MMDVTTETFYVEPHDIVQCGYDDGLNGPGDFSADEMAEVLARVMAGSAGYADIGMLCAHYLGISDDGLDYLTPDVTRPDTWLWDRLRELVRLKYEESKALCACATWIDFEPHIKTKNCY